MRKSDQRRFQVFCLCFFCFIILRSFRPQKLADTANPKHVLSSSSSSSTDTALPNNQEWQGYQTHRSLALIHVGKSAGLTLRAMTSLKCRLPRKDATPESIENCLQESFGHHGITPTTHPLVYQTMYYAHMASLPASEMTQATGCLWVLRHPLDRLISAFHYSHPDNCQDRQQLFPNSTKGCINYFLLQQIIVEREQANSKIINTNEEPSTTEKPKQRKRKRPQQERTEQQLFKLFVECFPQADMEGFVRRALQDQGIPTKLPSNNNDKNNTQNEDCSRIAQRYLLGQGHTFPIPHFRYNYQHYYRNVLEAFDMPPTKELFGIRTEHLWHDFQELNRQLGGINIDNESHQQEVKLTHGSERYQSTLSSQPLSAEVYPKLCCLLKDELAIYRDLIQGLWNLKESEKLESMHSLAQTCGVFLIDKKSGKTMIESSVLRDAWRKWEMTGCKDA